MTELYDEAVNIIGSTLTDPVDSIKSMCNIAGNDIQSCYECSRSNGLNAQKALLDAWWETCVTYQSSGQNVQSGYNCWKSVLRGSGGCSSNSKPNEGSLTSPDLTKIAVLATLMGLATWL